MDFTDCKTYENFKINEIKKTSNHIFHFPYNYLTIQKF